jgi:hypothetical protein
MQNSVESPTPPPSAGQVRYFGGPDITSGLELLPPRNFGELFRSYFLSPATLKIDRTAFLLLTKPEQALLKRQRYIVAGTATGPGPRTQDRMPFCSLVIVDVDVHEDARHFIDEESALPRLLPYNFILYRTLSSAPGAARVRVIIDAQPFPSADYPKAVRYVCASLGIAANPESLRWGQPMFIPTACNDDPNPLICYNLERGPLPHDAFRDYEIPANVASPETEFVKVVSEEPPLVDIELEDIEEMLRHIDPDTSYEEWFRILCAIRHQCGQGNKDYDDAGFAIFNDWSSQGVKYTSEQDLRAKWRSFRPSPKAGSPVTTLRTLLRLAKAAGWGKAHGALKTLTTFQDEIAAEEDTDALINRYPGLIAEASHLTLPDTEVLVVAVASRLAKLGVKLGVPTVRKAVAAAKRIAAEAYGSEGGTVPSWAAGWTFLATENRFVHSHKGTVYPVEGFTGAFKMLVEPDEEGKRDRPADLVLSIPSFPRVDGFRYRPDRGDERIITEDGDNFINSYRATGADADKSTSKEAGDLIEFHTGSNFPGDEVCQKLLISFLAHIVQFPGKKIKWAVFMQGVEGSGKGVYMDMMEAVLGSSNYVAVGDDAIESKFNEWAADKQLIFYDEVIQGNMKQDRMNNLKAKITNPGLTIAQKNKDTRTIPNTANDFFASNSASGIRIDDNDRRYFILQSIFQTKKDITAFKAANPGHFTQMFRLKDELAGGAKHYLLNYPIHPTFNPNGEAPLTSARSNVVNAGRSDIEWTIQEIIDEGNASIVFPDIISSSALQAELRARGEKQHNVRAVSMALRKMGFTNVGQHGVGHNRHSLWVTDDLVGASYGGIIKERQLIRDLLEGDTDLL